MPWTIDPTHTHVGFSVKHMMVSTTRGQFKSYRGTISLDEQDFTRSSVEGEIDVASLDTGNAERDDHLRNNDFFDAPNHPTIGFKSTRIERIDPENYRVYGALTMRGVTREVALDVEYVGIRKNPWGQTVTGFSVSGTLNRKDFGIDFNAPLETGGLLIGEKVKLELEIEAVKQDVAVAAS